MSKPCHVRGAQQTKAERQRWVGGRVLAASNHATQSEESPFPPQKVPLSPLFPRFFKDRTKSLVPLCIPKRRISSARSKTEYETISVILDVAAAASLLPSFLRDCRGERGARAISLQKGNRICREYRALIQTIGSEILSAGTLPSLSLSVSSAASLSSRREGLIWGVRNNTTGVKILGIPAAIQSLP